MNDKPLSRGALSSGKGAACLHGGDAAECCELPPMNSSPSSSVCVCVVCSMVQHTMRASFTDRWMLSLMLAMYECGYS